MDAVRYIKLQRLYFTFPVDRNRDIALFPLPSKRAYNSVIVRKVVSPPPSRYHSLCFLVITRVLSLSLPVLSLSLDCGPVVSAFSLPAARLRSRPLDHSLVIARAQLVITRALRDNSSTARDNSAVTAVQRLFLHDNCLLPADLCRPVDTFAFFGASFLHFKHFDLMYPAAFGGAKLSMVWKVPHRYRFGRTVRHPLE